jgi:hypothetical protein
VRLNGDDPTELLLHRFLCAGAGLLLAGPTGIGKSSFALQCALTWAVGKACFEITPKRPLKSLLVQAENDDNDLAEMRDGVLNGLDFTPVQSTTACESVLVAREDSRSGFLFFSECLKPLLGEHRPDLLWVDPALAYLGGESNSQRDVGKFLRNNLNPLLHEFACASVIITHTNKPPNGKEKPEWSGSDFAYLGTGSAEWANWARGVLAIRATGHEDLFELRAGKRGGRLGWRDESGVISRAKFICHANDPGVICWREADPEKVNTGGRPKSYDDEKVFELLPPGGLLRSEWVKAAEDELLMSEATHRRCVKRLLEAGRILKSKVTNKWQPIFK